MMLETPTLVIVRSTCLSSSEDRLQRQLNLARAVHLAADDAEAAGVDARSRQVELHAVEGVEELRPELCVELALGSLSLGQDLSDAAMEH